MEYYNIYVGRKSKWTKGGIYHYRYESKKNEIVPVVQDAELSEFTYLAISPGKTKLLVTGTDDMGKDIMISYKILENSKKLLFLSEVELQTAGDVCHVSISPDESIAAVTDFTDQAVHFYELEPDGRIGRFIQRISFEGNGTSYRQEKSHTHSARFTADNQYCIVADLGANCLWSLKKSEKSQKFEIIGQWKAPEGSGPRHIAFDKRSKYIYVITEITADVAVVEIQENGNLKELQIISALNENSVRNHGNITELGIPEYYIAGGDIILMGDGKYVVVSIRGSHEIVAFEVLGNGLLTYKSSVSSTGAIRSLCINEEETILFALGEEMGNAKGIMEVFALDTQSDNLLQPKQTLEMRGAFISCIA